MKRLVTRLEGVLYPSFGSLWLGVGAFDALAVEYPAHAHGWHVTAICVAVPWFLSGALLVWRDFADG